MFKNAQLISEQQLDEILDKTLADILSDNIDNNMLIPDQSADEYLDKILDEVLEVIDLEESITGSVSENPLVLMESNSEIVESLQIMPDNFSADADGNLSQSTGFFSRRNAVRNMQPLSAEQLDEILERTIDELSSREVINLSCINNK